MGVKVTNISQGTIYLRDLKFTPEAQTEGRRGEDRYIPAGGFVYLPNTSEVLRSAVAGDIRKFVDKGLLQIEDQVDLAASGSVTLNHGLRFPPSVYVLKKVGSTWVDGTGTVDIVHNGNFTSVTVTNTTEFALTFLIRLL